MIVADASAVIELLFHSEVGRRIESHLLGSEPIHAPALLDVEVAQVLRRMARQDALEETHAGALIEILGAMPIRRHSMDPLLPRIWALRYNLTAYDAAYVALGEALACPLLTLDTKIAGVAGLQIPIVVP